MIFLFYLFAACGIYQIVYQIVLVNVIILYKKSQISNLKSQIFKSVSIIICAKNEAENLEKNLPFILSQNYNDFEVIIVDDNSTDNTLKAIEQFLGTQHTLRIIALKEKEGLGKKYALQKGIENASKELILLTDADCKPVSESWISEMTALINDKNKIVLGISPYYYDNTFLNGLIEYETAQTAMQYCGYALLGSPYMSVGRNVCYDADLLRSKKWNTNELSIASGDDDLTVQCLASNDNTTVCFPKNAYTKSNGSPNWSAWIHQKTRHYESGKLYKPIHKFLLGSYLLTKSVFYLSFIIILCLKYSLLALSTFLLYLCFITIINLIFHKTTELNKRWYLSGIHDVLYVIFTVSLGWMSQIKPINNWK